MSLYLGNTVISGVTTPVDGSIAIGQIISSIIPLTDAGLHLLDGALIPGGGIYDDFVQYIANLSSSYPQCFTDETTWQNTVNSKGACGKFVYNSTNNTVRLPKITGFIEGTIDSNALGELVEAGLPNITGNIFAGDTYGSSIFTSSSGFIQNGSNTGWRTSTVQYTVSGASDTITFDASRSSAIYGNSNTVQPQAIKVFYYIVIATTTKTDIEVDIDEVITDLNTIDSNAVHKTGDEIIGGIKTLYSQDGVNLRLKSNYIDDDYNPSSPQYSNFIDNIDINNKLITRIFTTKVPSGANGIALQAWKGSTNYTLSVFTDGTTFAPTPNVSSNGANIATTAYVNTKFQVVSTLPANPDSNVYYFIPE